MERTATVHVELSHIAGKMNGGVSQGSLLSSPSKVGVPGPAGSEQPETQAQQHLEDAAPGKDRDGVRQGARGLFPHEGTNSSLWAWFYVEVTLLQGRFQAVCWGP